MAKASQKKPGPKLDPNLDYVLREKNRDPGVIMNNPRPIFFVESIRGGVIDTQDLDRAMKFKGSWLNDTVWYWDSFYTAIPFIKAQAEFKKVKHENTSAGNRRKKQGRAPARPKLRKGAQAKPGSIQAHKGRTKKSGR